MNLQSGVRNAFLSEARFLYDRHQHARHRHITGQTLPKARSEQATEELEASKLPEAPTKGLGFRV